MPASRVAWGQVVKVMVEKGWKPPPMTDRAATRLLDDMIEVNQNATLDLSPMQHRILQRAADGLSQREIAREEDVSFETVKTRFTQIRSRLGAKNMPEAIAIAFRAGLID